MLYPMSWTKVKYSTVHSGWRNYFTYRMPWSKSGKRRQKADPAAIGWAIKNVIINNTKVKMAASNSGISRTTLSCHLFKFQEQERPTDFEYTAKNNLQCNAGIWIGWVLQTESKITVRSQKGEDSKTCVVMLQCWEKNECAGNMWLRGLRKSHESLYLRKPEATDLTRYTNFNSQNVKAFFENLREVRSRQFHS
jgi:hypothetical protein